MAQRVLLDLTVLRTEARLRGIGRYAADLARGLSMIAGEVDMLGLEVLGAVDLPWRGPAACSAHLDRAAAELGDPHRPLRSHFDWAYRVRARLAAAARRADASLLHCVHPGATPLGSPRCPRLTTCHDLIPYLHPEHYARWTSGLSAGRRLLDRRRYRSADHLIAVSQATAGELMHVLDLPASRITVVVNGVDLERWRADPQPDDRTALRRLGLLSRRFVLSVGDADWRKNAAGVLGGFARARRHHGLGDLELAWAGTLSPARRARIETAAAALGLSQQVHLLGQVGDGELGALYRNASSLLFVSRIEGFGYPIVEALACGCPVVTSDRSSMAEIAAGAAHTVAPEDHGAIAAAVAALAADPGAYREAGLRRAHELDLARMARATLEVYRRLIA